MSSMLSSFPLGPPAVLSAHQLYYTTLFHVLKYEGVVYMRKFIIMLLIILLAFSAAAESDLAAMSTEDLIALRDSIDDELSKRNQGTGAIQVVDIDGLMVSINSVFVGTGRNDAPAICILFNVSNTSDKSFTPLYDIGCDILQDGTPLETTFFNSDSYTGPSVSDSNNTVIAPGVTDMQYCDAGLLSNDSDSFSIVFSRKHYHAGEDPYCGTLSFILSDYIQE